MLAPSQRERGWNWRKGEEEEAEGTDGTAGRVIRAQVHPECGGLGTALLICVFIHKKPGCVSEGRLHVSCRSWNSCVSYLQSPPCMLRPPASRGGSPSCIPPAQTGSAAAKCRRGFSLETRVSHFGCKVTYSMWLWVTSLEQVSLQTVKEEIVFFLLGLRSCLHCCL